MNAEVRAKAIRAAFNADNWRRMYSDEEFADQVEAGRTVYLERIVDAVAAVIEREVDA